MSESPEQNNPDALKPAAEQLDLKITVANPEDWKDYKEMRLEAITGDDAEMFGATEESVKDEKEINDKVWRHDLADLNMFVVLARNGDNAIGMGAATQEAGEEEGLWRMRAGYVKPEFRNKPERVGKQMFKTRLDEIVKRGGKKVILAVKRHNATSIHIAESFGFKRIEEDPKSPGFFMELDLHN